MIGARAGSRASALFGVAGLVALAAPACSRPSAAAGRAVAETALSAGAATVFDDTRDAFSLPMPVLSPAHRTAFFVGNSFFNQNWVGAPASVTSRDGLGPLFNARSCSGCHFKDGRGRPPEPGAPLSAMLLRIGTGARDAQGAPVGDPVYGDQIQGGALVQVPREADVWIDYEARPGQFADGERYQLREPRHHIDHLGYGPLAPGLRLSPRVPPAMIGLGLLEAVPGSALREMADPEDRDGDGISGRVNLVWDVARAAPAIGRFGWKAEQPTVRQQSAGAFLGDMGLTTTLFPVENHTAAQEACHGLPNGGSPEVSDEVLRDVALYARALGVPARRRLVEPAVARGAQLFARAGCATCHTPTLRTEPLADLPEVGGLEIHPYSDLLLHDMGEGLGDQRPAFTADGREWRTAPLWGIGLIAKVNGHTFYLHDGRARDLSEAVLWHDGEARAARDAFSSWGRENRRALIAFLESL